MGTITVNVGWDRSRQEVVISQTCSYTLLAQTLALAHVRETGYGACGAFEVLRDGNGLYVAGSKARPVRVTQRSATALAQVQSFYAIYLDRRSGEQRLSIAPCPGNWVGPLRLGGDYPAVWLVTVSAPMWSYSDILGPVESQSEGSVTWRVEMATASEKKDTPVTCSVDVTRTVKTTGPPTARHQTRGELLVAFTVAVAAIGAVAAALVARLAGPAVPRRWARITLIFAAAVCGLVALPVQFVQPGVSRLNFQTSLPIPPDHLWTPPAVLGLWLWYVLPVSAWWFTHRALTGGPPSGWTLTVSCVPPLLSLALMVAGGTELNITLWTVLAVAALLALSLGTSGKWLNTGPAVRRWAPSAGALLWTVVVTYEIGRTSVFTSDYLPVTGWNAAAVLVCTWPAAAWLGSLVAPALRRTLRPAVRRICSLLLWGTLVSPFVVAYLKPAPSDPFGDQLWDGLWSAYRVTLFKGYAAWPLFVMTVCGIALQIAYLWRRGAMGDTGRAVEPVGRVLLMCAALTAFGAPDLRTLTMWGEGLAVFLVAIASLILLPLGSDGSLGRQTAAGQPPGARPLHGPLAHHPADLGHTGRLPALRPVRARGGHEGV